MRYLRSLSKVAAAPNDTAECVHNKVRLFHFLIIPSVKEARSKVRRTALLLFEYNLSFRLR